MTGTELKTPKTALGFAGEGEFRGIYPPPHVIGPLIGADCAAYSRDAGLPVVRQPSGRLLVGFSKSGWGAFSLLLRHPELFSKAAAWDAPLMMQHPDKYGMQPIFASQANFEQYQVSSLLRQSKAELSAHTRLLHLGYGNFREHHQQAETLMNELGIRHMYRDGPLRSHDWHSGWLVEAVELLVSLESDP